MHVLVETGHVDRARIAAVASGFAEIEPHLAAFSPEATAFFTGIAPAVTRRIALEFADARRAVAYTRIGTCNNAFGTLGTWATDLLNIATGRLGAEGGWMFPEPALDGVQFTRFAGLNGHARWDPPVVARAPDELADWQIMLRLAEELGGGPVGVRWVDTLLRRIGFRYDPERALDLLLRFGPHGDRFLPWSKGINLKKVKAGPYGVDLGPARTGFRHRLQHRDGKAHLTAGPFLPAMAELADEITRSHDAGELLLIGRRELRSNNSWMHNVPALVAGLERCVLLVHPADAARAGLRDSQPARLESRTGTAIVPVRVSDDQHVEGIVGQSILNSVPVRLGSVADVAAA